MGGGGDGLLRAGGTEGCRAPASELAAVSGCRHQLQTFGVVLSMPQCLQNIETILRPDAGAASPKREE